MKTTNLFQKALLLTFCAIAMAACSAESESTPAEPDGLSMADTPKSQDLKTTPKGETKTKENTIYMEEFKGDRKFDFEFTSKRWAYLTWNELSRGASLTCNFFDIRVSAQIQEMKGKKVAETLVWDYTRDAVLVEAGKKYRLRLNVNSPESCKDFSVTFAIMVEPTSQPDPTPVDTLISEAPLILSRDHYVTTNERTSSMYFDYNYTGVSNEPFYLSYVSESVSNDCNGLFSKQLEWLTLDANGKVVETQKVDYTSYFYSKAGAKHKLRVWVKNAQTCDYFGINFAIGR